MRKLLTLIAIIMITALSSCDHDYIIRFVNCTQDELTVVVGYLDERNDTTIIIDDKTGGLSRSMELVGNMAPLGMCEKVIVSILREGHSTGYYIDKKYHGVMHIFIVRAEDVEKYGWKKVADENMVVQRYDIKTFNDNLEYIEDIYFPPVPSMMHYDMWPPYGTYRVQLPE